MGKIIRDGPQFSATKSSGVLGTSMAALGLAIAWVDSELSFCINRMESVVTNVNSSDILTESDIPGALLPQEAPELCNVVQLKRWLTYRGASTTGRKVELVSRLVEVSMAS